MFYYLVTDCCCYLYSNFCLLLDVSISRECVTNTPVSLITEQEAGVSCCHYHDLAGYQPTDRQESSVPMVPTHPTHCSTTHLPSTGHHSLQCPDGALLLMLATIC